MHFLTLPILLLSLAHNGGPAERPMDPEDRMILFDFETLNETSWQVVNDGVMGGRSQGYILIESGTLRFTGTLVTLGGGFTSVRARRSVDLAGFDGLELRLRGGGRTFEIEVDDDTRRWRRSVSRRAAFETQEDWVVVRVPFNAFRATVFGRSVSAPPMDLTNVKRFGLFIADGKDGPFSLEVDSISAYRLDAE